MINSLLFAGYLISKKNYTDIAPERLTTRALLDIDETLFCFVLQRRVFLTIIDIDDPESHFNS